MGFFKKLFGLSGKNDSQEQNTPPIAEQSPATESQEISEMFLGQMQTFEEVEQYFQKFGLSKYYEMIKPQVRDRIDIDLNPADDDIMRIGQSKVGGKPDLPVKTEWPKTDDGVPLAFIAQINCEEAAAFDKSGLLPKTGLISFFYSAEQEAWGFDPADYDKFSVLFTDGETLHRREVPGTVPEDALYISNEMIFSRSLSLPTNENEVIDRVIAKDDFDTYLDVSVGVENQMFGYANNVQGEMELECQLVTNGLYCGDSTGYQHKRVSQLKAGKKDWVLLFQIGSEDEKTGMMWGDVGRLYFWIKKQDLEMRRFDKSWFALQCY